MGLFDFFSGGKSDGATSDVLEIAWSKNAAGKFRRLPFMSVEPENLSGISAIYIIWHGGTKPGWVYVGYADDLETDLADAKQSRDIMDYDQHGGLFVTWQVFPKKTADGVFAFLSDVLQPEIRNPEAETYKNTKHVRVLPPGYKKETFSKLFG